MMRAKRIIVGTLIIIGVIALMGEPTAPEASSLWLKQFVATKATSAITLYIAYRMGVKWACGKSIEQPIENRAMNATVLMTEATATQVQLTKLIAHAIEQYTMPQSLPLLVAGV